MLTLSCSAPQHRRHGLVLGASSPPPPPGLHRTRLTRPISLQYCDRTFEDQRVLLSHQKAKHFRCPMCPRRLNTAGGLGVHLDQVHKVGTDKCVVALSVLYYDSRDGRSRLGCADSRDAAD